MDRPKLFTIIATVTLLIFLFSCNYKKQELESLSVKDSSIVKYLDDLNTINSYRIDNGNKTVFIYKQKGTVFVDANDYEPTLTEYLIFEIDPKLQSFEYKGKELEDINCHYSWNLLTKELQKGKQKIGKGIIMGKKIDEKIWEITANIDTDFKIGGYLERQNSRKINFTKRTK